MCIHIYIHIYTLKYYERKKGRNYISRQACFVNRFTLQGFNVGGFNLYMYVAILGKEQRDYALIPTSLFRDCLPIGGFYC